MESELALLLALMLTVRAGTRNYLMTYPQNPVVEIGSNFTATCVILNTSEVTVDDLYWNLTDTTIPREHYSKINSTALNVTVTIQSEKEEWLFCLCKETSPDVIIYKGRYIHGIYLLKGYAVGKPENLSCVALQDEDRISENITCRWDDPGRQTKNVPTTYTLFFRESGLSPSGDVRSITTSATRAQVSVGTFPHHINVELWVEAKNLLGWEESEHLQVDANGLVKTDPPASVSAHTEVAFPTSVLLSWKPPIEKVYLRLKYRIRYRAEGQHTWTHVPEADTSREIQSFRLQNLQPFTLYECQVSCKNAQQGQGYWSNWSNSTIVRTPEDRPKGKPDLWWTIIKDYGMKGKEVQIICKEPKFPNGRITHYVVKIQDNPGMNGSLREERVPFNLSDTDRGRQGFVLKNLSLPEEKYVQVFVSAVNSVGSSAVARLIIPQKRQERPPVEHLRAWPQDGQLMVEWQPASRAEVSEYVVQWSAGGKIDWQRESRNTTRTGIKGDLEQYVCYTVSVCALFSWSRSCSKSIQAYLKQGAPEEAPFVTLIGVPGHDQVQLTWTHLPAEKQRGFITNYTLIYRTGGHIAEVNLPGNSSSYKLSSLSSDTTYDIWLKVTNAAGSASGSIHSFTTQKYAPGEIERIVVGVSLGFLFVFLMTVLVCFYKKDVIKENFWPQIPDPSESTLGNWTPDHPLKVEPARESCVSGISVLDVDVCDGRSVFDEEKSGLKKDKFLSEEHSSGIGGSSCMSSPRQSVSDSDEGGDMADTTASTVQYSSVVASSGYKGQTPRPPQSVFSRSESTPPPQSVFSRSESTQPLLDSEENHHGCHMQEAGQREELQPLDFCPLQEDSENNTPSDDQSATPSSSYMPQLGGYRPQ